MALILALGVSTTHADFIPANAAGFAVLFEGGGNNHLSFNNGTIMGGIGIGAPSGTTTAQLQLSGGAANSIINGNVQFAGAANVAGTAGTDYSITAGHTITGNNPSVQAILNSYNSLSSTLGGEAGSALAVSIGNGGNQTVNASSGTLDANGNRVFTVNTFSFVNGASLTINGSASEFLVFNFSSSVAFGGAIHLTGGLTSDNVLFNITGGSGLTGGNTLTLNNNGAILTGTFLDPNGSIQMNHTVLDGRLIGGDSHDEMIVSGASIFVPAPEPGSLAIIGLGLFGLAALRLRAKPLKSGNQ
ncbi:MAG: hypothetical protein JWR26_3508 [Pedosphaera sp.]|nr:hypothetical protein [Pedosphaera sp.]